MSKVRALGAVGLGLSPWLPGQRRHGLRAITPDLLTRVVGRDVVGARVMDVASETDRQTTDRARLQLTWNDAGRAAGLPSALFAKGTPSLASSRVLNSAFGLCGTEVRFYHSAYDDLADLTLRPYHASIGRGGRFLLVLESRDPADTNFFTMADEATPEHAAAIIDALARMHARFHGSSRFESDLAWVTPYSRRPGQALAPTIVKAAEKRFHQRYEVPDEVARAMRLHVGRAAELAEIWESLPPTLCHGDTHMGNTFRTTDGVSGLFDWQEVHRMNGIREVAYFIASAFSPERRRKHEHDLLTLYRDTLAVHGVHEVPSADRAFELYRLMMLDAWRSVWASLALMPVQTDGLDTLLIERHCGHVMDLDVAGAAADALSRRPPTR